MVTALGLCVKWPLGSDTVTVHVGNAFPLSSIILLWFGPLPQGKMDELLFFEPDKKEHIPPPVSIDNGAGLATNAKESGRQLVNSATEWMCLQVSPTQSKLTEASPTRVVSVELRQLILLLLWYRVLESCQPFLQCLGRFWASSNQSRSMIGKLFGHNRLRS